MIVLSQRSTISTHDSTTFPYPVEASNRVRESKQRLASKQLVRPASTVTNDEVQPIGTWLDPAPPALTTTNESNNASVSMSLIPFHLL